MRMLGGDANQHCVDCIRFENETESDTSGVLPNITREQTREEKAALLIKQFEEIGSDYDGMILDQQTRIRDGQVISQSHGDWASDSDDISGLNKTAGGLTVGSTQNGSSNDYSCTFPTLRIFLAIYFTNHSHLIEP